PPKNHTLPGRLFKMRRLTPYFAVALMTFIFGFVVGWWRAYSRNETDLNRVVAMSWGDGKYGPAFYGAHVYLEPQGSHFIVRARVHIGRSQGWFTDFHDCGILGTVATEEEAVAHWGTIQWRDDGLQIGTGADQ